MASYEREQTKSLFIFNSNFIKDNFFKFFFFYIKNNYENTVNIQIDCQLFLTTTTKNDKKISMLKFII
jgi:hypothetical protein